MPRPLVLLLLVASLGLGWWLWPGADPAPAAPDAPRPSAAPERPERLATGPEQAETAARAPLGADAPGAPTIAGRVEVPVGAGSDRVEVLALPVEGGALDTVRALFALHDGGTDGPRPLGRTTAAADGRFRLELAEDGGPVRLVAIGPRCWSPLPVLAALGDEDVRLRCRIGARIVGRALDLAPGGDAEARLDLARTAATRAPSGQMTRERTVAIAADGSFAFDAVPLLEGLRLRVLAPDGAARVVPLTTLTAGEERQVEIRLQEGVRIVGRVLDERGAPVAGADVAAFEREPFGLPGTLLRETTTDEDGRFVLAHVRPTGVIGQVAAEGFRVRRFAPGDGVDGTTADVGELALSRGAELAGRVRLADGRPAADARVEVRLDLLQGRAEQAEVVWRGSEGEARTGPDGAFRVAGLEGDAFEVRAELDRDGRTLLARRVGVRPGDELVLDLLEPLTLTGRVVSEDRAPVPDFALRVARQRPSPLGARTDDARSRTFRSPDGAFELDGLLPGRWTLGVEAPGHATPPPVDLDLPLAEPLVLTLERGRSVAGTVVDPEGRPLAGALVRLEDDWFAVLRDGARAAVVSDAEGRFELGPLSAGEVGLVAEHERYVASLPVVVAPAEGAADPRPVLALRTGGTIRGRAWDRDGAPFGAGRVMLIDTVRFRPSLSELGPDGRFEIRRVEPGTYQVLTIPDLSDAMTDGRDASLTARLLGESASEVVQVADGELVDVELGRPSIDPVRVEGRVTRGGEPAARHFLSFIADGRGLSDEVRTQTDDGGRYAVVLREPGRHLVTVTRGLPPSPDQSTVEFRREVPAGAEHRLDLELPEAVLGGRVTDVDGRPLVGVVVHAQRADGVPQGSPLGGALATTVTDADGRYRFDLLRPGRYHVRAGGPAVALTTGAEAGWGAVVRSDVELPEGGHLEQLDFVLAPAVAVAGRVVDAAGTPAVGATVFVRDALGRPIESISLRLTDAAGRFRIEGLAPGRYSLLARRGTDASPIVGPVDVGPPERDPGAAEGPSPVELELGPGTLLIVRVEVDGEVDPGSRLRVLDAGEQVVSGLIGLGDTMRELSEAFQSDEFRVGPLPPGRYRVIGRASDGREQERTLEVDGQPERRLRLRID